MKIYATDVDSCFNCPYHEFRIISKVDVCNNAGKELQDTDIYKRDSDGFALSGKYPDWCPLPNKVGD